MQAGDQDATSSDEKKLQQEKLEACVSLLLSAGYFRARLPKVDPFDKVSMLLRLIGLSVLSSVRSPCATAADLPEANAGRGGSGMGNRLVWS